MTTSVSIMSSCQASRIVTACRASSRAALALIIPTPSRAESDTSSKPANLAGREDELSLVKGAQLNKVSLRHAEAYRSSWINAHLWKVDFQNANLSEADLRGANLRQAVLRSAVLDRAKLD